MELITVISADYLYDYCISLQFNDGVIGTVDLKNYLDGEIFEPLKDQEYFKQFTLDSWTIGWGNGADFAPEFLYNLSIKKDSVA
jgi:hypothetical protein